MLSLIPHQPNSRHALASGSCRTSHRRAFTLVELLMVIAIIGVIAGLAITGYNVASRTIQKRAIAMEVMNLAQAVESYKLKYDSYPPDGSSRAAFEAHFKGVFPNMAQSEFTAVYRTANSHLHAMDQDGISRTTVMDPAEALVFCLGGFSNDPQYPFTGAGGPILLDLPGPNSTRVPVRSNRLNEPNLRRQYNIDRNEGFFPMSLDRLTAIVDPNQGIVISTDEAELFTGPGQTPDADFMPTYKPRGKSTPVVYFSAATYSVGLYDLTNSTVDRGAAKPLRSDQINTNFTPSNPDKYYRFMNDKTFQIISAGLDDHFGGSKLGTQLFFFPSGKRINVTDSEDIGGNYQESDSTGPSPQLDNVTNFSDGPLEDSLP
ncbi:MAG: type II secretion system protein [Pirellulaceae bacterium]|nr:type II secretion system protein [Pirellulaceae bacterium]